MSVERPERVEATVSLQVYHDICQFLYREGRLLDEGDFEGWNSLFAENGVYWIPMNAEAAPSDAAALVYDTPLRREERVHHLLRVPFASQSPPSRMLHEISGVEVLESSENELRVMSCQVIHEHRTGDFRQVGLGKPRTLAGRVTHVLTRADGAFKIQLKRMVFQERDLPLSNMTVIY